MAKWRICYAGKRPFEEAEVVAGYNVSAVLSDADSIIVSRAGHHYADVLYLRETGQLLSEKGAAHFPMWMNQKAIYAWLAKRGITFEEID